MADSYLNLETTEAGLALIARSLYGDKITFTKIVLGNGVQTGSEVTGMVNPLVEVGITAIEKSDSMVILTGYLTSSDIDSSFYGTEMGVYAKDSDGTEQLFAYRYNQSEVDYYPATSSGRAIELTFSVVIQIGSAENVTAILIEGDTYAKKEDFDSHVADQANPHSVTKEQIGLGHVEDKAINDQTPTYTTPTSTSNLSSGETLSTAFGKLAAAVKALIVHIADKSNPHGITAAAISAANVNHSHGAADINSGTLSILRGGTGASAPQNSDYAKVRKATLSASSWSSSAPYTLALTVSDMTADYAPIISMGIPASESSANYIAARTAYALIDKAVTGAGKITFTCYTSRPGVDIPILIKGV